MTEPEILVADSPERERYEVTVDGELAGYLEYRDRGGRRILVHTQVDRAHAGRGLGGRLAKAALDDVTERGMGAVARCPFVRAWVGRHPEYAAVARVRPDAAEGDA
jgi:predicted GNAT family acetyltransferase